MGGNDVVNGEDRGSDLSQHARDVEKRLAPQLHRSAIRALIQDFGPLW